ncbi:MAG: hypothetical protein A2284_10730 [Deltaproteobacteria bacterium RIFOXYA12_FULL_61_11]|nr:MAG: hypothetical protein A2284_10730 [Deltaproteobacteria bacterium RIFOXYA12_FULL_61_11]
MVEEHTTIVFRSSLEGKTALKNAEKALWGRKKKPSSYKEHALSFLWARGEKTTLDIFNNTLNEDTNFRNWTITLQRFEDFLASGRYTPAQEIPLSILGEHKAVALTRSCSVCIVYHYGGGNILAHYIPLPDREVREAVFPLDSTACTTLAVGTPLVGAAVIPHTSPVLMLGYKGSPIREVQDEVTSHQKNLKLLLH